MGPFVPNSYHRQPPTVGASEKQRKIWSHLRHFAAMEEHDRYLGSYEIDSDSLYQSLLNTVFECADDGSVDATLLNALDTLKPFREMRRYVYGDPVNAGLSFLGIMPTVQQILEGAKGKCDNPDDKEELKEKIEEYVAGNTQNVEDSLNGAKKEGDKNGGGFSVDGDGSETELLDVFFGQQSRELRKMLSAVGVMSIDANAAIREKRKNVMGEYADITQGQDLGRLIQSEFMNLATPEMEDMFWARWAQDEAVISEVRGKEYEGRGPLVLVVDESGSMEMQFEDMSAHQWARSIMLTLAQTALKAGRPVHVVKFSSQVKDHRLRRGRGGSFNTEDFRWLVSSPMNGGTAIYRGLERGFTAVKNLNTEDVRADIVLITDFVFRVNDKIAQFRADSPETRVFGVLVADPAYVRRDDLEELCDEVHVVSNLADTRTLMSAAQFISPK